MGPRPDGRGKWQTQQAPQPPASRQWGRGQTAAESRLPTRSCPRRRPGVNGAAARRPRKVDHLDNNSRNNDASMGPRPDGRGKQKARALAIPPHLRRQWGRGQTAAESRMRAVCQQSPLRQRQWGRGQTAAESRRAERTVITCMASMGPRPDGRGKRPPATPPDSASCRVNGAAARRPRKAGRAAAPHAPVRGVNGAAARRPRKGRQAA